MKRKNNNFFIRFYNHSYNFIFKKLNNIQIDKFESKFLVNEKIEHLNHSTALQTAWLLNLKRLYNLVNTNIDLRNYHFIDAGCGNGIPLIYAYKKLIFKSYSGFDFVTDYINITKLNIKNSIGNENIKVFKANASNYRLEDKSYFIFMCNPFDGFIMDKFIQNNYENLVKNKSIIGYANCKQLEIIKRYTDNILEINKFKLAVCFF